MLLDNRLPVYLSSKHDKDIDPDGWFPLKLFQDVVHDVILDQCDDIDGVKDGVLVSPKKCRPNFEKDLLCGAPGARYGGSPDTCLNQTQIDNLKTMYKPFVLDDEEIYPAFPYSYEQTPQTLRTGGSATKAAGWYSLAVLKEPELPKADFDVRNLTTTIVDLGDADGTVWNGPEPDLSAAINAGTKILSYHGLSDITISPYNTENYYNAVHKATAGKIKGKLQDHYRYYEVPGMSHCRNGAGPWHFGGIGQEDAGNRPLKFDTQHDMLLSLVAWVEKGDIGSYQVGVHYHNRTVTLPDTSSSKKDLEPPLPEVFESYEYGVVNSRKLCPYPKKAVYKGGQTKGSKAYKNFQCE